jgi:hypothetical protein
MGYSVSRKKDFVTIKIGVLMKDRNKKGETFVWRTEHLNRSIEPDKATNPKWFDVAKGKAEKLPLCELHVDTENNVAVTELKKAAFDTESQPIVVRGVNPATTAYMYEKGTDKFRPVGVWDKKVFVQVPGNTENVTLVVGNIVIPDRDNVKVEMFPITDRNGKLTGKWLIDAHNNNEKDMKVTFSVPEAFDFIKTRSKTVEIPVRSSVRFEME